MVVVWCVRVGGCGVGVGVRVGVCKRFSDFGESPCTEL